jgi:hypothetical protein
VRKLCRVWVADKHEEEGGEQRALRVEVRGGDSSLLTNREVSIGMRRLVGSPVLFSFIINNTSRVKMNRTAARKTKDEQV